ncbi:MAG: peptidylprolyl isomerase [Gemmatimonadota bacterium]|nr:peptidylprolyl isomerase [Gemmatimonadota bacterium]
MKYLAMDLLGLLSKRRNHVTPVLGLMLSAPLLINSPANAQIVPDESNVVERVVAVVGDSVILMTELDEYLLTLEARGWSRPTDEDEFMKVRVEVLDQLINEQLVLQDAARDTLINISDVDLEDRVQREIDGQILQFGTIARLQQMLAEQNMTMAVFRDQRKEMLRRQLLQERYFAKQGQSTSAIAVTETEARAYFEENRAQMPQVPPTVRFEHLQLSPEASDAAKADALTETERLLEMLMSGEDFAELATRFSHGPSSSMGGELGWIRQDGSFVPEFEEIAFRLSPGRVSSPVETEFGYHLITVERVRGGERRVRHILIQPEIMQTDIEENDARVKDFGMRLEAGEVMADLSDQTSDTLELSLAEIAQISEEYAFAMQDAAPNEVIGPIPLVDPRAENSWGIAKVLEVKAAGLSQFEDVRDLIEERLKSQRLSEIVVEGLRNRTYIEIRLAGS